MQQIVVLGAGLVGRLIAADLSTDFKVTSVDGNADALGRLAGSYPVKTEKADLSSPQEIARVVSGADLVIGALPGFMGFETLKAVITNGKNVVDISFFGDDPFLLDDLARKQGVTALVDCGVAPGLSNIILGYHHSRMTVERFECYVGGLPVVRRWPFEYKAPFSPIDVIEEYTRPSRIMENGVIVVKPALSEPELLDFEEIGTLEAFNTDGLRTLLKTMPVPNMKEKTLRYPGHINYMRMLRETGFFSHEPITLGEARVRPIDLTSRLLFSSWKLEVDEAEFTVMRVVVTGKRDNQEERVTYRLLDRYDPETGFSSMARTTGYTCSAAARLLLSGRFTRKGICPPEYLGAQAGCFEELRSLLKARGVILHEQ